MKGNLDGGRVHTGEPVTGIEKVAGMMLLETGELKPSRNSLGLQRGCHPQNRAPAKGGVEDMPSFCLLPASSFCVASLLWDPVETGWMGCPGDGGLQPPRNGSGRGANRMTSTEVQGGNTMSVTPFLVGVGGRKVPCRNDTGAENWRENQPVRRGRKSKRWVSVIGDFSGRSQDHLRNVHYLDQC